MRVSKIRAMALGWRERSGVTRAGEAYNTRYLPYVVEGEAASRTFYVNDDASPLLPRLRSLSWGDWLTLDGDVDGNGRLTISEVSVETDSNAAGGDFSFDEDA